jgi:Protein of unknown function (DUF2612)
VAALLQPLVDAQAMLLRLIADFDLDTAIGVQLDMVGQWIGRTRFVHSAVEGVFFSFDLPDQRVGFDQGVWLGPFQPTDQIVGLDDETYRAVLKLQAVANQWDGTLSSIAGAMDRVFPGVVIHDRGDIPGGLMAMDVLIPGSIISSLTLAVLEQDFPIKPAGVRVNFIETTVSTEPLFGFDIDAAGAPIRGFDHGVWGKIILTV